MNPTALRHVPTSHAQGALAPNGSEFGLGIDLAELGRYVQLVRRKVAAGEHVYRTGQPFHSLFLIHAGFFKTTQLAEDGREQVCEFHMRGDLLGVEAIGTAAHSCDAIALEDGEVWELPYPPVLAACARIPELHARLTEAMANEIRRERSWLLTRGTLEADQRVAAFLLDVSARYAALGFSAAHFLLRMGRVDIASFLALKHETVTRALTRLCKLGCIAIDRRDVRVLDPVHLRRLSGNDRRAN